MARSDPSKPKFNALDDGAPKKQQGKKSAISTKLPADVGPTKKTGTQHPDIPAERLQIKPGESMRDFARRVDQAIPVTFPRGTGSVKALKLNPASTLATRQIAHELKEWERKDAEMSEEEDAEVDYWAEAGVVPPGASKKRKRAGKGGKDDEEDPWKVLEEKRAKIKFGETADAPPQLKKPKAVFKVYEGAGVNVEGIPKSVGSLMKREELASERAKLVAGYRKMMEEKRADDAAERANNKPKKNKGKN